MRKKGVFIKNKLLHKKLNYDQILSSLKAIQLFQLTMDYFYVL